MKKTCGLYVCVSFALPWCALVLYKTSAYTSLDLEQCIMESFEGTLIEGIYSPQDNI